MPVALPRRGRGSVALAVCGVLAGIAALVLAGVAIVAAHDSSTPQAAARPPAPRGTSPASTTSERSALAMLAKPSTERIVFDRSGGRLVLAVGSGGRAALLARDLGPAPAGTRYYAWRVLPGRAPVPVAHFVGTQRVVFLPVSLRPTASVVVTIGKHLPPPARRLVASRG
jgi:anti-sigma-K factor RskA